MNSCPNDCTTGCPNGKPGPSNTGPITPKSQLANYNGPMTITQEGTVIEGVYINSGTLSIKADNVVIRDVVIDCGDGKQTGWPYYCLQATFGAKNLIVEDVEIFGGSSAIVFANDITLRRAELHTDGSDAMKIRSNSLVEENWIHHPLGIGSKAPHADAEQMRAGSNTIFRCNNMDIPINYGGGTKSNACFIIQEEVGDIKNVLIDNNWCNGGNFGVFLRSNAKYGYGCLENVIVSNNKFGRDYRYGLMSQNCDDGGKPGYTCGNIWEDTGDTITKANGGWDQDDDVCS